MTETSTDWDWSNRRGLVEATIHFADRDGRDMSIVLHEVAHILVRAKHGKRAAVHGLRFQRIEDTLCTAFDVPVGWDRKTGYGIPPKERVKPIGR